MSATSTTFSAAGSSAFPTRTRSAANASGLRWHEWAALAVGVNEINLQIDSYLMFHERDAEFGAVAGINISVFTICLGYLYAAWIGHSMLKGVVRKPGFLWNPPMLIYIAIVASSMLAASVPMLTVFDVAVLVQAFAIFFYLANRIKTVPDVMRCTWILASAMCIQALIVFVAKALGEPGTDYYFGPIMVNVWEDGRPGGTMHSPVLAGSAMAIMWVPVLALTMCQRNRLLTRLGLFCTAFGMLGILCTQTRGAIITAFFGAMMIGWMLGRRGWLPRWSIMAAAAFALLAVYPLFLVIVGRVANGDGGSASARAHLAMIAMDTIKEAPLFGHGSGNCHLACEDNANQAAFRSEWYYTVHCKYLLVWIETGIIGLLGFLAILGNGIRHGLSAWRNQSSPVLATLGLGFTAALLGHMTHLLVDVFNSRTQVQLLWVLLGITAAIYRISHQPSADRRLGGVNYGR